MKKIAFSPPDISQAEIDEVTDTLKSGWITTGPKTKTFEKRIAEYCHTERSAALNSATACLELALRLLGIGPGDEVITSAYSYTASASVIAHVGAKIVLVDCGKDSFHLDYEALYNAINKKTKVIIPVDIGGVMCDYDKIKKVIETKKALFSASNDLQSAFDRIIILADAAHSFGARYKNETSGQLADFSAFSFHAVKNLTTAEGGAVTWLPIPGFSNEYIYNQFMLMSLHGQSKDALAKTKLGSWEYDIIEPYYKCNMTDIMASIGLAQLKRYSAILSRRKRIIEYYDSSFSDLPVSSLKHYTNQSASSGHLYLLRLNGQDEAFRNKFIERMAQLGIATNVHYKPMPMLSAYEKLGFTIADYPQAFEMYKNEITLPLHTLLSDEDVDYICSCVRNLLKNGLH